MREQLDTLVKTLLEVLLGWAVPMGVLLFGCGLYAISGKFSGIQQIALQGAAWACWINSPIYNLRGYAEAVRQANEAATFLWFENKRKPPELTRFPVQVEATRFVYPELPDWEPKWVEALAHGVLARRPFTEREYIKIIPVQRFRDMQHDWLEKGMAEKNERGRGSHPTEGGKDWARKVVTKRHTPSPTKALSLKSFEY